MQICRKQYNSNYLKFIAIIAMTIDHATDLLYPGFPMEAIPLALHFIGRRTALIMWFFVCEGTGLLETKKRSEKSRLSELISTGTGHSVL